MKNIITLDKRLELAVSFVTGSVCADIGTDHAYIPIHLLQSGKCRYAIASDINEGPLKNAEINAKKHNVYDKIFFALTDGLEGLPLEDKQVSDIVICGMGGELIAEIIDASTYTKNKDVNLILQPMSSVEELRTYLYENGYTITDEGITMAQGKLYQCISCRYSGEKEKYSPAQLMLGKINIKKGEENPYFKPLVEKLIMQTQKKIDGKIRGGVDHTSESALLSELCKIIGDTNDN